MIKSLKNIIFYLIDSRCRETEILGSKSDEVSTQKHISRQRLDKKDKIKISSSVILLTFGVSVIFFYWQGYYFKASYPYNTYLFNYFDRFSQAYPELGSHFFGDLYGTWAQTSSGSPYYQSNVFYNSNYFPFAHFVFYPLAILDYKVALSLFILLSLLLILGYCIKYFRCGDLVEDIRNVFIFSVLSYPVQFVLDRGNIEIIVFAFVCAFFHFFENNRPNIASFFLACASSVKGFPGLLFVLFIKQKKYRYVFYGFGYIAFLTLISLLTMKNGLIFNFNAILEAFRNYSEKSVEGSQAIQHSTSLYSLLKCLDHIYGSSGLMNSIFSFLLDQYWLVIGLIFAVFMSCLFIFELENWEMVTLLVFSYLLLPKSSYDYRLIYIFIPFRFFVNAKTCRNYDLILSLLFGCLFSSKSYLVLFDDVTVQVIINPLIMLAIATIIVKNKGSRAKMLVHAGISEARG